MLTKFNSSNICSLKDVVPLPFLKDGSIEKDIFKEWRTLIGATEMNCKLRYVQLCRSMKTWGITTFKVKLPPTANKKKQVTLLLGVTRESVCTMDEETKVLRGK